VLQSVRISVGRTWRLTADGAATVEWSLRGYRRRLGAAGPAPYGLPWPQYRSGLWGRMFGGDYRQQAAADLVAALVPLRHTGTAAPVPGCRAAEVEALRHPFALTAFVHLELAAPVPWPPDRDAAAVLRATLTSPYGPGQVRDGVPLADLPALPSVDADDVAAGFVDAGRFVLASAVYEGTPDPTALAGSLAVLFDGPPATGAVPLRRGVGALGVSGDVAALVLPNGGDRVGNRIRCLHYNYATLLAYLQNLTTLTPATTTETCRWFQQRSAVLLNHLYRREPLPSTRSVYRSRLPQAWLDGRRVAPAVNAITGTELPLLPVPT
jgi:hypothetical protein